MTITIDRLTQIISIPQADLTLISGTLYKADTNAIRLTLKAIEASEEGIVFSDTHIHNTTVTLFGVVYARLIEVISPYSITFTPDILYSARLDGSNNNYGDVEAGILNQNSVQVIPTNSAGLQDLSTLLTAAYQGIIAVDVINGQAGTSTPVGTRGNPSNNMIDAQIIADNNSIVEFAVLKSLTLTTEDFSDGHIFTGDNPVIVTLTLNSGTNVSNCIFRNLTIQGELDGGNIVRNCDVLNLTYTEGFVAQCSLTGTITIAAGLHASIIECYSNVTTGEAAPIIDLGGTGILTVVDYVGILNIQNATGVGIDHHMNMQGGKFIFDASCTEGIFHVRGEGQVEDNSTGNCVVMDHTTSRLVWEEPTRTLTAGDFSTADALLLADIHGQVSRAVYIDTESVSDGPNGYQQAPFNAFNSGADYAETNDILKLVILTSATVDRQLKNFTITGIGGPTVDLNAQIMDDSNINNVNLTGSYTGTIFVRESALINLSGVQGSFLDVSVLGTLTTANAGQTIIAGVAPALAGQPWTLDMNTGGASTVSIHNSSGGIIVDNMDNVGDVLHILGSQGEVTINASCVLGTIVLGGTIRVIDNSNGTSVNTDAVINPKTIWNEIL